MFYHIKKIFNFLWFPTLLIIGIFFILSKITNLNQEKSFDIVLGVALGVVLGFVADIAKSKIDELQSFLRLRKTALKLLEDDTKKVYTTVSMIKSAIENVEKAPKEIQETIKNSLPPKFELRYWRQLNKNNDFLFLGSEKPFTEIFNDFWELEKLNELITKALNKKDKQSFMFAFAISRQMMQDNFHINLLKKFITESDIEKFERNWKKQTKQI